jgi:hypothetical protein
MGGSYRCLWSLVNRTCDQQPRKLRELVGNRNELAMVTGLKLGPDHGFIIKRPELRRNHFAGPGNYALTETESVMRDASKAGARDS